MLSHYSRFLFTKGEQIIQIFMFKIPAFIQKQGTAMF